MDSDDRLDELLRDPDLRPVADIAQEFLGKRESPQTTTRWVKKGLRGGKLIAVFADGWRTTPTAFADFLKRQTRAVMAEGRSSLIEQTVEEELVRRGLLPAVDSETASGETRPANRR